MSNATPVLPRSWPYTMQPHPEGGWRVRTRQSAEVCITESPGLAAWLCQYTRLLASSTPGLPDHDGLDELPPVDEAPELPRPWPFTYERNPRGEWIVATSDSEAVCTTLLEGFAIWLCHYTRLLAQSTPGITDGQGTWW